MAREWTLAGQNCTVKVEEDGSVTEYYEPRFLFLEDSGALVVGALDGQVIYAPGSWKVVAITQDMPVIVPGNGEED